MPRVSMPMLPILLALAAVVVTGCATPPPAPSRDIPASVSSPVVEVPAPRTPVLARDDQYVIVSAEAGDDFPGLARRYRGDASLAFEIAEATGKDSIRPGDVVVIPLRARNPLGVEADGYQTVSILCYHRFGPKGSRLTVTPAAFEAQMDYLARNGYHVVSMAAVREFLDGKRALPRKSVAITIDDGYRSTYEVAYPVLRKHGFPATVFLYSDFVGAGDALTWTQMKEMTASRLIEIQPHSKSHANLSLRLADETDARYRERIRREVEVPVNAIRERLDQPTKTFAYPYGDVNDTVVAELSRLGIPLGVTVTPGGNGFFAHPQMLKRSMVFGDEGLDAFKARLVTFVRTATR